MGIEFHHECDQADPPLIAVSGITRIKESAKAVIRGLDPDRLHGLSYAQRVVVTCIGRGVAGVLGEWTEPHPTFPANIGRQEMKAYQRQRELDVLSEAYPNVPLSRIKEVVAAWRLVAWHEREFVPEESYAPASPKDSAQLGVAGLPRYTEPEAMARFGPPAPGDRNALLFERLVRTDPLEVFMPPALDMAEVKAIVLDATVGSVSRWLARQVTARVWGFTDWDNLNARFVITSRSQFDEELHAEERRRRRGPQVRLLQSVFQVEKVDAVALLDIWKPTSQVLRYEKVPHWDPAREPHSVPSGIARRISGRLTVPKV